MINLLYTNKNKSLPLHLHPIPSSNAHALAAIVRIEGLFVISVLISQKKWYVDCSDDTQYEEQGKGGHGIT